jgi:RNA polymerase sigma factor (sigma-70 family)
VLRWALHFAQNNRAFAQDLVQETFVRILNIRNSLTDLENVEPLLYTHLRYAYLTECRRRRANDFQPLAAAHLNTLSIGLRSSSDLDQIEIQNELRDILAFLSWRRRSAKFASIFLLRFFHGFLPEEIAAICLITRGAVDLGLMRTREELRGTQANPQEFRMLQRASSPDFAPSSLAISSDDFANELVRTIFNSFYGTCPEDGEWERRYRSINQRPLAGDVLAHLVSCRACLDRVTPLCGTPPPNTRSMGEALGRARRPEKFSSVPAAAHGNSGAASPPRR